MILIAFQHVAYEYAKRRACLVLVARREDRLRTVADKAKQLGSPDVLVVKADISNPADCKNFVDQTILHFHKCKCMHNICIMFGLVSLTKKLKSYSGSPGEQCWGSSCLHV